MNSVDSFHKNFPTKINEARDTNQSILKLADLLDEKKEIKKAKSPDIVEDNNTDDFFKVTEESPHEELAKKPEIFNEDDEKSRNFLPSIQNLSAISHNLSGINRKNSKKTKKKPLYEINRKENLIQNELKLLNREKKDYVKQIEKKHHIKMVMIKSNDLLKRNYQNLYNDPYQIEVIDEEDLENSLDNINYFLNKKNTPKKFTEKGPHLYIFPHVNNTASAYKTNNNKNNSQFGQKSQLNNIETSMNRSNLKEFNNENLLRNTPKSNNFEISKSPIKNTKFSSEHHKIDLLESKINCEIIKEEFEPPFIEKPQIIRRIDDNYQKSYNDLVSYRRNMKEQVILEHKRVKSQLDKRKKNKKKKEFFKKEIIGNEVLEDISRITQNQGKINIINDENFKKVLSEIVA